MFRLEHRPGRQGGGDGIFTTAIDLTFTFRISTIDITVITGTIDTIDITGTTATTDGIFITAITDTICISPATSGERQCKQLLQSRRQHWELHNWLCRAFRVCWPPHRRHFMAC